MPEQLLRAGSGVLIRVADLNHQRIFYRETLHLGEPVVDSDFWCEFSAPDGSRIILEKSQAPYLEHAASATTLVLATRYADEIIKDLMRHKHHVEQLERVHPGEVFYRGQDPEGNVFYLCKQ